MTATPVIMGTLAYALRDNRCVSSRYNTLLDH
jgi:hypothetical protein